MSPETFTNLQTKVLAQFDALLTKSKNLSALDYALKKAEALHLFTTEQLLQMIRAPKSITAPLRNVEETNISKKL